MTAFGVAEIEALFQRLLRIGDSIVGFGVDFTILDSTPKPFDKHVVHPETLAISYPSGCSDFCNGDCCMPKIDFNSLTLLARYYAIHLEFCAQYARVRKPKREL